MKIFHMISAAGATMILASCGTESVPVDPVAPVTPPVTVATPAAAAVPKAPAASQKAAAKKDEKNSTAPRQETIQKTQQELSTEMMVS